MGLLRAEEAEGAIGGVAARDQIVPLVPRLPTRPSVFLWIDETPRPGWANMSIDMTLLDRAEHKSEHWLRLYQWDPHCLSFGRHEPAAARYDTNRIRALGLDTVRRPTGGRAVWHARELTYAVASPVERFGSLREAYLEIHQLLARALRSLGLQASLAPRTRVAPLDTGACFSQLVGGEVLVNGRKVIGSAQLRRGRALLQHGSILLHHAQRLVADLMRPRLHRPSLPRIADEFSLADELGRPLPAGEVADTVADSARRCWTEIREPVIDPDDLVRQAGHHTALFRSSTWTWAR